MDEWVYVYNSEFICKKKKISLEALGGKIRERNLNFISFFPPKNYLLIN